MNVLKPHLQTTIATLIAAGKGQREIARITGVDRKTIRGYQAQFAAAQQANSPTVTTGSEPQIPPPRPPATGAHQLCAPYQEFVRAQVQLHRNATAIYQDLVDQYGFTASYESVKRFVRSLRHQAPKQFDRLQFLAGE